MSCKICNREVNVQIPMTVQSDLLVTGELELLGFCLYCMYVISKAYNNLLESTVNNKQAFNWINEILRGAE